MNDFDLGRYSEASREEGFCMLHTGIGESRRTKICMNLAKILTHFPPDRPADGGGKSRQGVYIGYLAYPNPNLTNQIPDARFYAYQNTVVHNHSEALFRKPFKPDYSPGGKWEQSVTKATYIQKIRQIKELLADGEIYQLNYAIRFRKKFSGSSYHLFLKWIEAGAAPFSAFLNGGNFQILSNSPERLFSFEKNVLMTQPIKGTAPKSAPNALQELLASQKERAELDMITDLERNDVGKLCKYGTLRLTKEREVMELPNLFHTYSEVRGDLPRGTSRSEIVKAMFPGGSITGCPKLRAMQYIEKLEGLPRNIFTGSVFHMAGDSVDASICIRTALVHNGIVEYWAGGGIVADSDPEAEYAECLLKAEKFLSIL